MIEHTKSYIASASPYVVDLRTIGDNAALPSQAGANADLTLSLANFDIEVVGNAAAVTVKGTGHSQTALHLTSLMAVSLLQAARGRLKALHWQHLHSLALPLRLISTSFGKLTDGYCGRDR